MSTRCIESCLLVCNTCIICPPQFHVPDDTTEDEGADGEEDTDYDDSPPMMDMLQDALDGDSSEFLEEDDEEEEDEEEEDDDEEYVHKVGPHSVCQPPLQPPAPQPHPPKERPGRKAPRTTGAVAGQPESHSRRVPRAGKRSACPGTPPTAPCAPRPW